MLWVANDNLNRNVLSLQHLRIIEAFLTRYFPSFATLSDVSDDGHKGLAAKNDTDKLSIPLVTRLFMILIE